MIFKPHAYQQHCISKILEIEKLGLFLDMGLGKTITTLTAIRILKYDRFLVRKVLVIAPKKVAEGTWTREKDKWESHADSCRVSPVLGSQAKADPGTEYAGRYLHHSTGRTSAGWWTTTGTAGPLTWSWWMSPAALRATAPNGSRHWRVSGRTSPGWWNSPEPRHPMAWMISGRRCSFWMEASAWEGDTPSSGSAILIQAAEAQTAGYTTTRRNREAKASILQQDIGHLHQHEGRGLPAASGHHLPRESPSCLDPKAQKGLCRLWNEKMILELPDDEGDISVTSAAALSNKLLQLANGALYDDAHQVHEVHNCKVEAFMELVESLQGKPALVFYNFQHDRERILAALRKDKAEGPGAEESLRRRG